MTKAVEVDRQGMAVQRLLGDRSPSIRYWTLRDILGRNENDREVLEAQGRISSSSPVQAIFDDQHAEGYWAEPEDVYWPKWTASVWPLILLAEIGVPGTNAGVRRGCEFFLKTIEGQDRSWPPVYTEQQWLPSYRCVWEPCVTGNMARTLTVFGFGEDPRVREMYEWLVRTPLPDGGWNCEPGPWGKEVFHSSFTSTIEPLWAFSELPRQKWPKGAKEVVEKACEFMLMHRLYKSDKTGKVIDEAWTKLHFPLFYEYDILHGLRVLTKLGYRNDARLRDAVALLNSKRLHDGTWPMEDTYVNSPKKNLVKDPATREWLLVKGENVAKVPAVYASLGTLGQANPWVTLNALRVSHQQTVA